MKQWVNKDEKIVKITDRLSIVVKKGIPARDAKARYIKKMQELGKMPKESKRALVKSNNQLSS